MQKVIISIDTQARQMNVMFTDGENIENASVFRQPLDNTALYNDYVDYARVFGYAFKELLTVNNVAEANLYLCVPTHDVCCDFITVPNLGNARKNEDSFKLDLTRMYPFISDISKVNYAVVNSNKTSVVTSYTLFGAENLRIINDSLVNTNHNLVFLTGVAHAACGFMMSKTTSNAGLLGSLGAKENVLYVDMTRFKSECAYAIGNRIVATYTLPYGFSTFERLSERDFADSKSLPLVEQTAKDFEFLLAAFIVRCTALSQTEPKRIVVNLPQQLRPLLTFLNRSIDFPFERFNLPDEYALFATDLELASVFADTTDKAFNFGY